MNLCLLLLFINARWCSFKGHVIIYYCIHSYHHFSSLLAIITSHHQRFINNKISRAFTINIAFFWLSNIYIFCLMTIHSDLRFELILVWMMYISCLRIIQLISFTYIKQTRISFKSYVIRNCDMSNFSQQWMYLNIVLFHFV